MGFEKLEELAKVEYAKIRGYSHDWAHIKRVTQNAIVIGKKEGANLDILIPAAILHDLGRLSIGEKEHSKDTIIAKKILNELNYSLNKSEQIILCIKEHSFDSDNQPATIESKILYDADKIDSFGVIGVTRFLFLSNEQKLNIAQTLDAAFSRIKKINDKSGFQTKIGKLLGSKKAKLAMLFYYLLAKELNQTEKSKYLEKLIQTNYGKDTLINLNLILEK